MLCFIAVEEGLLPSSDRRAELAVWVVRVIVT